MLNTSTNIYILILLAVIIAFELLITKLIEVSAALPMGLTIALYLAFVLYQVILKLNEEAEKNKVKALLFELMDTINGIPVMNKNERLFVKWDLVFKKLVDFKEFALYDRIVKTKTQHLDFYINKYPSLLIDDSIDMKESRYNTDLNSTIRNRRKKEEQAAAKEELVQDADSKKKLFIRSINNDTASFSNYNSSIYIDVMLKNEYMPEDAIEAGLEPDPEYDGFSIWMAYKNSKYNVVPRVMVHKKLIDKTQWFIDNINSLLECAASIVENDSNNILYIDNFKLLSYLCDMPDDKQTSSILRFKQLKNEMLIFAGTDKNNKTTTAYCEFKSGYNRFEVILKLVETQEGDKQQRIELEKTVAIGSSFQPLVTMLEKMPELINNIELVINNQDINSIVIS